MPYSEQVRRLIHTIAVSVVDDVNCVSVSLEEVTADSTVIVLQVSPAEVGKIIGKQGRMARSIRTVLSVIGIRVHHRYQLEIKIN